MFLVDDTGIYEAPVDEVWAYLASLGDHRRAHHHRHNRLEALPEGRFLATWEQELWGAVATFSMRGTPLPPLGIAYEVLSGPFEGSVLLQYYTPMGNRTRVTLAGQFVSPTLPEDRLEEKVRFFFDREFDEDQEGLHRWRAGRERGGVRPA